MEERSEKREKFEELAEKRMSVVKEKIRILGNLANKTNYDYTPEHVEQIISTLLDEVEELEQKFYPKKKDTTFRFKRFEK